ncbi:hypothetical protein GEU84_011705 [Fertoebacter nigrum]|uniref:Uncharacterized protein n=1 Tax=Fertoeibacter niger TaxID=2656921 RepID=A0A8X8H147_9RHOB|nr:hypothetical protein [Fertoeibacter niger]NUB45055.1 hypothetical protein [Fertoeibacter niger]
MSDAYVTERMYRTISHLTLGLEEMRVRLPKAYDDGFKTIAVEEVRSISSDLAVRFGDLKEKLSMNRHEGMSWAELSVADLSDLDLVKTAEEILDIHAIASDIIEMKRLQK